MQHILHRKLAKYSSYTIDFQTLKDGLNEFDFDVTKELFQLWEESEIDTGSGNIHVTINKTGNNGRMTTKIDAVVGMPCDRCLDEVEIKVEWSGECVIKVSDVEGEYDGDIIWLKPNDEKLDLAQYFYESVVLGLPIYRVHQKVEDCNQEVIKYLNFEQ